MDVQSVILDGDTFNDGPTPPNNMASGGSATNFLPMLQALLAEIINLLNAMGVRGTSTSSETIGDTGSKTFVLAESGLDFRVGMRVTAADNAAPATNQMSGLVTAWTSGTKTLVFTADDATGSGTKANWSIFAVGAKGDTGATGSAGAPGEIQNAIFDAHTLLIAISDNTPIALTVAEDRMVGRVTGGGIVALTAAQILTLLNVAAGAQVNRALASQAEAKAGTNNVKGMTPLRTAEAIAAANAGVNTQTADYTLVLGDDNKIIRMNKATAVTLTLENSLPVGWACVVIQTGAGQVTFTPEAGATLENIDGETKTEGQKAICSLFVDANSGGSSAVFQLAGRTAA